MHSLKSTVLFVLSYCKAQKKVSKQEIWESDRLNIAQEFSLFLPSWSGIADIVGLTLSKSVIEKMTCFVLVNLGMSIHTLPSFQGALKQFVQIHRILHILVN